MCQSICVFICVGVNQSAQHSRGDNIIACLRQQTIAGINGGLTSAAFFLLFCSKCLCSATSQITPYIRYRFPYQMTYTMSVYLHLRAVQPTQTATGENNILSIVVVFMCFVFLLILHDLHLHSYTAVELYMTQRSKNGCVRSYFSTMDRGLTGTPPGLTACSCHWRENSYELLITGDMQKELRAFVLSICANVWRHGCVCVCFLTKKFNVHIIFFNTLFHRVSPLYPSPTLRNLSDGAQSIGEATE